MTSTNPVPPPHVRHALAHLEAQTVMNNYGSLFLHDLDLSTQTVLPEIQEHDTEDILRLLGLSKSSSKRVRQPRRVNPIPETSIGYPLGPAPSWSEIARFIEDNPEGFTRPYVFELYISDTTKAAILFRSFTIQIWLLVHDSWLMNKHFSAPKTVEEAMEFWTMEFCRARIARVSFKASNGGLTGSIPGHKELSFRERATAWYFPPPDQSARKGSQWWIYFQEVGYIHSYHNMLQSCDEDDAESLNNALTDIFGFIQVLPWSCPPSESSHGWVWKKDDDAIKMVVNPHYYLMREVGGKRSKPVDRKRVTNSVQNFVKALFQVDKGDLTDIQALSRLHTNMRKKDARQTNVKRSTKARNRRAPPHPRNRKATAASSRVQVILSDSDGENERGREGDEDREEQDGEEEEEDDEEEGRGHLLSQVYNELQDADEQGELTEPEHLDGLEMDEGWEDHNVVRYIGEEAEEDEEEEMEWDEDVEMEVDEDFMDVDDC